MNTKVRHFNRKDLFMEVDTFVSPTKYKPPRIGISANRKDGLCCISETYVQSVLSSGAVPILIPTITDIQALTVIVEDLDGLIMSGGGDINPLYIDEEPIQELQDADSYRDEYDLILLRLAAERQLPILGICRGHQLLNIAFGGTIYQDIHKQHDKKTIKHSQAMPREQASHTICLTEGSFLFTALGGKHSLAVNSFHHQAIKDIAPEFISTAVALDGINEGIEHEEKPLYGVQWHPECMASEKDEQMVALFNRFKEACALFAEAKKVHNRILTVDSHTDTPMIFPGSLDLGRNESGKVNLPFMEKGLIDAVFMVAYLPQKERDKNSLEKATAFATERINEILRQEQIYSHRMGIARSPEDAIKLKRQGKKSIFIGIENGYAIGKDLSNLVRFKELGVSYITLCHNGTNDICDSGKGAPEWGGLSPFGQEVVKQMNKLGIMVDVSHAAESTFYDVLECSQYPIIASHSSVRKYCDHPRNLTDDQIKALAEHNGVMQICLYKGFINENPDKASISDAIKHIQYVVDLVGFDHVGIGSDFDGDGELIGCRSTNELINITGRLIQLGYTEENIRKIWGGNLMRVMKQVQQAYPQKTQPENNK